MGVVGLAYPGYSLGENLGPGKLAEMAARVSALPLDARVAPTFVRSEGDAQRAGMELAALGADFILAVLTTFVPDTFIVELLRQCDRPLFLWAVERELPCIALVCVPLITATLHNLDKRYHVEGADIADTEAEAQLVRFARAAAAEGSLRKLRAGYCGGRCPIMLSMSVDEDSLRHTLGVTVVAIPVEEFYDRAKALSDAAVSACWQGVKTRVGQVSVRDEDGLLSARYYLAARCLADTYGLHALSLNCFPHLKSKICLAVAMLNDDGIAAACEGDLHSTILMHLLGRLAGRAAFNGDWLRMYPEQNEVLFSHCGAGAFSLAKEPREVCLRCSLETRDGLAVCFAAALRGPVTLANLMNGPRGLRLAVMQGTGVETDLAYEGTPLKVRFPCCVKGLLQRIAGSGAGHHWNGIPGDYLAELRLICERASIPFTNLTFSEGGHHA